jgi:ketosteroid isomerase-like protein
MFMRPTMTVLLLTAAALFASTTHTSARAGIEKLHQLDIQATLTDNPDELTKLWDQNAIRLLPGMPAEIGKAKIYEDDKQYQRTNKARTLCYRPEIHDLQIAGDWAFEWDYFSYKESDLTKPGSGKAIRIMKRQPDGSWKFAEVAAFPEPSDSAAPIKNPCE